MLQVVDALGEVGSGLHFIPISEMRCAVNERAAKKAAEDLFALGPVHVAGHPAVFGLYLAVVLIKARSRSTQDGQVNVYQQLLIRARRRGVMACSHDQFMHTLGNACVGPSLGQRLHRPLRTEALVVVPMNVVNRVVEPQGNFNLTLMGGCIHGSREVRQALLKMLLRVVAALWLAVGCLQLLEKPNGWWQLQVLPCT